jgi:molybdenum cofactor cytidylyltransferase
MKKVAIIVLAAGESRRMGQPKQLLEVNGQSLLRHTVEAALGTNAQPVVVVIGAHKKQVVPELANLPVTVIDNQFWQTGMASSVKMGMAGLWMITKETDAVLLLVCDQPYVSTELLQQLIDTYQKKQPRLVACRYAHQVGVPALFDRSLFEELLTLDGEKGAKPVLMSHLDEAHLVRFEQGIIDLDTPDDYQNYQRATGDS